MGIRNCWNIHTSSWINMNGYCQSSDTILHAGEKIRIDSKLYCFLLELWNIRKFILQHLFTWARYGNLENLQRLLPHHRKVQRTSLCIFYIQLLIDMVSTKHFKIRLSPPIFIINGKCSLLQDRQAVAIDPSSSPESWPGFLRPITCKIGTMWKPSQRTRKHIC